MQQQQAQCDAVLGWLVCQQFRLAKGGLEVAARLDLRAAPNRQPGRALPVAQRRLGQACCGAVASQDFGLACRPARPAVAQDLQGGLVAEAPVALPKRGIGGVLHQGMPELIAEFRPEPALAQNARTNQGFEVEHHAVHTDGCKRVGKNRLNQGLREAAPDHTAKLCHHLGRVESVQPGHQQVLHPAGHWQRGIKPPVLKPWPRLGRLMCLRQQGPGGLLDKQWHAVGAFDKKGQVCAGKRWPLAQLCQQGPAVCRTQAQQLQSLGLGQGAGCAWLAQNSGGRAAALGLQQQQGQLGGFAQEQSDEFLAGRV